MPVRNPGTHQEHCCVAHGCKYGNPDCPVENKTLVQTYPCEDCGEDWKPGVWSFEVTVTCPDGTKMNYTKGHIAEDVGGFLWENLSRVMGIYES